MERECFVAMTRSQIVYIPSKWSDVVVVVETFFVVSQEVGKSSQTKYVGVATCLYYSYIYTGCHYWHGVIEFTFSRNRILL